MAAIVLDQLNEFQFRLEWIAMGPSWCSVWTMITTGPDWLFLCFLISPSMQERQTSLVPLCVSKSTPFHFLLLWIMLLTDTCFPLLSQMSIHVDPFSVFFYLTLTETLFPIYPMASPYFDATIIKTNYHSRFIDIAAMKKWWFMLLEAPPKKQHFLNVYSFAYLQLF